MSEFTAGQPRQPAGRTEPTATSFSPAPKDQVNLKSSRPAVGATASEEQGTAQDRC